MVQQAFAFVQGLAAELSDGTLVLPCFPEVALRVHRALGDPNTSIDRVVQIVGSEPSLAARIMSMANSAAYHSDRPVGDLRSAIMRLGCNAVRCAALAFAMAQLKSAAELRPIATQLRSVWERSMEVAALCGLLAKQSRVNEDEAFLAGLMHAMGCIYILARAGQRAELFADQSTLDEISEGWQANIGKAILQNWNFPEAMAEAIGDQDDVERRHYGTEDLTDVLITAKLLQKAALTAGSGSNNVPQMDWLRRLRIDPTEGASIRSQAGKLVAGMRAVLG